MNIVYRLVYPVFESVSVVRPKRQVVPSCGASPLFNDPACSRRLALRVLYWQLCTAASLGLSGWGLRWSGAVDAAAGILIVVIGGAPMWLRAFDSLGGGAVIWIRFLIGWMIKWMLILAGLVVVLVQFKLSPLAIGAGLVSASLVHLLAFRFKG